MNALEESQQLMAIIQGRFDEQDVVGGAAALQMLERQTALAIAEQIADLATHLKHIGDALDIMIMQLGNKPK